MADPYQNMALIQQMYQQALSPIDRLGSGLLSLALDRRNREQALQDQAAQRAFQLDLQNRSQEFQKAQQEALFKQQTGLETARQDFESQQKGIDAFYESERQKQNIEAQGAINAKYAENQLAAKLKEASALDAAKREDLRKDALDQLRGLQPNQTFPDNMSYGDILRLKYQSQGRQLIAAADAVNEALGSYSSAMGSTTIQVAKQAMAQAIASNVTDAAKDLKGTKLTSADLNRIANDPSALMDLQASLLRQKDEKGLNILRQIQAQSATNIETGMAAAAKDKPFLENLAQQYRTAKDNFANLQKLGGYDEPSGLEATKRLLQDVGAARAQTAAGAGGSRLPGIAFRPGGGGTTAAPGALPPGMSPAYAARMGLTPGSLPVTAAPETSPTESSPEYQDALRSFMAASARNPLPPGGGIGLSRSGVPQALLADMVQQYTGFPRGQVGSSVITSNRPLLDAMFGPGGPTPEAQAMLNQIPESTSAAFLRAAAAGQAAPPGGVPQATFNYIPPAWGGRVAIPPMAPTVAPLLPTTVTPLTPASVALQNSLNNASNLQNNVAPTAFPFVNPYARPSMPFNPAMSPPQF